LTVGRVIIIQDKIKTIKDTLHSFPTGINMDLEYMVDLGKQSQKNYPVEDRVKENFIHGCTSNAWIKLENNDPIQINTVSDSVIISGLLYLLEKVFNGEPKSSIDNYSGQDLIDGFGLDGIISSQRLRGFAAAVKIMKGN
jgi:sulfur transfer protein SufE